jgi:hypothetical protein
MLAHLIGGVVQGATTVARYMWVAFPGSSGID